VGDVVRGAQFGDVLIDGETAPSRPGLGAAMLLALAAACGGAGPDVGRGGAAAAEAHAS